MLPFLFPWETGSLGSCENPYCLQRWEWGTISCKTRKGKNSNRVKHAPRGGDCDKEAKKHFFVRNEFMHTRSASEWMGKHQSWNSTFLPWAIKVSPPAKAIRRGETRACDFSPRRYLNEGGDFVKKSTTFLLQVLCPHSTVLRGGLKSGEKGF